jgi:hypothetical protein
MKVLDAEAGHWLVFRSGWQSAAAPIMAAGGLTIDTEARTALAQLIEALNHLGILATPST